jgi:hypothetical protein
MPICLFQTNGQNSLVMHKANQNYRWIGLSILLLAAWLRLGAFHEALVGADQSSILAAAAEIAAFRSFPLVGIKSSVGVMQTAVTPYLAAIPLLIVPRVIAIKWFFSVLDLLALAFLFRAVGRSCGRKAAAIAALLYATNPWVVEFVRWIWYQSLVSTFATVAFAAFLLLLSPKTKSRVPILMPLGLLSAALMGMVHLAAVPWAALLVLLAAIIAWRKQQWSGFLLGIGISLLAALPYLLYLVKTDFVDVRLILAGGSEGGAAWNWATYRLSWELLTGRQVFTTPRSPLWAASVIHVRALYAVVPLTLSVALLSSMWHLRRTAQRRALWAFTLAWTLLAPTLFLITRFHLQHFYLLFLFPAPYVLIGAGIESWLAPSNTTLCTARHGLGRIAVAALLALALWWTYIWTVRIGFESQGQLRAPTRAWLMDMTVDHIDSYLKSEPEGQVIVLTDFEGGDLSPFDWLRNFVGGDQVRVVPAGQGFIIPAGSACYLLTPGASEADLRPVADVATERPELRIPATPPWRFHCTPPRAPLPAPLAEWDNGMHLLNTEIEGAFEPGGQLALTYTWHYRAVAPKEYHIFNHLLLGETPVAQVDGTGVPTWYWRDDDVLITHFVLQLPETLASGTYRLLIGSYTWPDVDRVFLTDGEPTFEVQRWETE